MNWKEEAKKELLQRDKLLAAIGNIKERLVSIQERKTAIRSLSDSTPVQGGGNRYEDRLLDLIVEEERLKHTLKATRIRLNLIERGLAVLTDTERTVALEFASNRPGIAIELLRDKTGYEQAQLYRIWDAALYSFTIAEYGISEF